MAQNVPGERTQGAFRVYHGDPPKPTVVQAFVAWLLVYGIHFALYGLSWVLVFFSPLTNLLPAFVAGLVSYAVLGFMWGASIFVRLPLRSRRHLAGLKLMKSWDADGYRFTSIDLGELEFFGKWFGIILGCILVAWVGVIYAVAWPIALLVEIE